MQADYPARFERDMGCTDAEFLHWLPGATQGRSRLLAPGHARVEIDAGHLELRWHELPARRIALMRVPRLAVSFVFEGVGDAARLAFMKHFDLYTQRGGG